MPSMRAWDTTPDSDYYNEMIPKVPVTRDLGILSLEGTSDSGSAGSCPLGIKGVDSPP